MGPLEDWNSIIILETGDIVWLDMGFSIRRIGIVLANIKSPIPMVAQSRWAQEIAKVKWLDSNAVEEYLSAYLVLYCREEHDDTV